MSHLNIDQIDSLIGAAGVDATREILEAFWQSTEDLMQMLRQQIVEADFENASRTAHAIKGSAANVGAAVLEGTARNVENTCRNGDAISLDVLETIAADFQATRLAFEDHLKRYAA